tara:strand:+ start:1171 stop:1929 length:759 start_codon:yes stop_codon:yes gene_type:complete
LIISKKLSKFKKIRHGFFNRAGGKSTGIYKSLNCGPGSGDKKKNVIKNLSIVKNKICKNSKDIYLLHQTHSNKFIFLNKFPQNSKKLKADAIITNVVKLPIAVLTADCAPILLYDKHKNMIAAIHAGWKGAFKGIVSKVINFMIKKGCKKNHITAVVGPCISQRSYNVREDFKKKFLRKNKKNSVFFKSKKNILYFDLSNYIRLQLKLMNISKIDVINIDTFDKKNNFFSARRSLTSNHGYYGRNISLIMIN